MAVYAMHGIFSEGDAKAFQNRCLIREDKFEQLLSSLPFKFVSLDDAVAGRGEALTVDDATNAAYRAAKLARQHGHAVLCAGHLLPVFCERWNAWSDL